MKMTKSKVKKLREKIEALSGAVSDEDIIEVAELLPKWETGKDYEPGDRVHWTGIAYKCLQTHRAIDTWNPADAPSLWAKIINEDPSGGIPDWVQPDSTNPYMKGDKVRYKGKIYESLIDNNTWSPEAYPAGWAEVTE